MIPDPSNELFQKYERHYQDSGAARWQVPIQEVKERHLDRLPRWIDRIDPQAHILDAGCANGYMLSLLWDAGYHRLVGVEVSRQLAAAARNNLNAQVIVEISDVREFLAQTADSTFDVILFHHVLEHIPREHTISLLAEFYRCLKPDGYLSVKVPNASFLLAGNHCFGDFTHVVHFNERSLPQVLEAAGFSTCQLEFILHPPKLFWSWHQPHRALLRALNRVRWLLHRISHQALCALIDQQPVPKVFEAELEALVRR